MTQPKAPPPFSGITEALRLKAQTVLAAHISSTKTAVVLANHWKAQLARKIIENDITGTPFSTRYLRSSDYGLHVWHVSPAITSSEGEIQFHGDKANRQLLEFFMLEDEDLYAAGEALAATTGRIYKVNEDFGLLLTFELPKAPNLGEGTPPTGFLETAFENVLFGLLSNVRGEFAQPPELYVFVPLSQLKAQLVDLQNLHTQILTFVQSQ